MPTHHPANQRLKWEGDPFARDPDLAHACAIMLTSYCDWLNMWQESDGVCDRTYTPTQFLDHDPKADLYGQAEPAATYDTTDHRVYVVLISDGDDGGPHTLTGYFWDGTPDQHCILDHMTQEFDTSLLVILHDTAPTNTPQQRKATT